MYPHHKILLHEWVCANFHFSSNHFREHSNKYLRRCYLTAFVFIHKTSQRSKIIPSTNPKIYKLQGPLFFGTATVLEELTPKGVLILDMRFVSLIDPSGMFALKDFAEKCKEKQSKLLLFGVQGPTQNDFDRLGLLEIIGKENIFPDKASALAHC